MRIGVHRRADIAMSENLLYHFRMNAHSEEEGSCTMPEIVKPYRRQASVFEELLKFDMKLTLVKEPTKTVAEYQIVFLPGSTSTKPRFCLTCAMLL